MNSEVKELIDTLKEYADGFTSVLAPTEEDVKALLDYINQLEINRDELKKWLKACLEENNKIRLYDNNSYQAGEINTLENVIDKMEELERGKE